MAEILVEILVSASGSSKSILLHYETITPSFLERTEQSWKFTDLQANNFQSFLYFFLISAAHTHTKKMNLEAEKCHEGILDFYQKLFRCNSLEPFCRQQMGHKTITAFGHYFFYGLAGTHSEK